MIARAGLFFVLVAACVTPRASPSPLDLPTVEPRRLEAFAGMRKVPESSGVVASRKFPGLYWTHSDSGGLPVLYAIDGTGAIQGSPVRVTGAVNVDWEDIAADDAGRLWIGDIGNNFNIRTDLGLWVVSEPDPFADDATLAATHYTFTFPEQKLFPSPGLEFDAEALFVTRGLAYILTKHRRDGVTVLYRLEANTGRRSRELSRLGSFEIGGMVTAADVSADGRTLVILTYEAVWMFQTHQPELWFDGRILWLPVRAGQCEAIAIDRDGSLVITNEGGSMFRLQPAELVAVRESGSD